MRGLRPEDVPLAERVVLDRALALEDERIVRADVERLLVGDEETERVGELADHVPAREVVRALDLVAEQVIAYGIHLVVPHDYGLGVELLEKPGDLFRVPGEVEVPAGEEDAAVGVVGFRLCDQALQHVHLQAQVGRAVLVAEALAEADRVEEVGLAVGGDRGLGEVPVGIEPLVLAHVPHAVRGVPVAPALLREEVRLHPIEELVRRAGIPVAHRAEVLRHHQSAVEGVVEHRLAQEAAELERPEERAVVVAGHRLGERLRGVGVVHHIGICLLERVVHADARHDEVEAALDAPVDLLLPVLEPPVLGLEAREAAVREIAEAAEFEGRALVHVEPRNVGRGALRHHVAVPEPAAAAAPLEEVVDGVERAASVDGGELQPLLV